MGYWEFVNVTERNHWMTLNTAFIHTKHPLTSYSTSQHKVDTNSSPVNNIHNNNLGEEK